MNYRVWFLVVLLGKLFLLASFSSGYSVDLFYPFVRSFVSGEFNPWQFYCNQGFGLDAFPYHALMLYVLVPMTFLIKVFHITNALVINTLFKLPLLFADFAIFIILLKLFPQNKRNVFLFYFINPIIIYSTYVHSQLDIVPMAFLFIGLYLLSIEKLTLSALLIGCALACKFHILAALPILGLYLLKKKGAMVSSQYLLMALATLLFFDLPFLFSSGFIQMVLFNSKQSLLFDSYYVVGGFKLFLPVMAVILVYFSLTNQKKINLDLLFSYLGLLFTGTIFFIYQEPAWYVWIAPFIAVYFIQSKYVLRSYVLYITFSVVYLLFFILFYRSEYQDMLFLGKVIDFKLVNVKLANLLFTFLELLLFVIIYIFYKHGVKSNLIYALNTNIAIGIGGDSGVGKSSLLMKLEQLFGDRLLQVEGDGEHKWGRGHENWSRYTHLDPKANYIHKQADAISQLKRNHAIYRSEYNHSDGTFSPPLKVAPRDFIAISGLHPFYLPKLRHVLDIKIYIDTDERLRRHWKIIRDTKKRGYSTEKILSQIESRMEDAEKYIYTQRDFADFIIRYFSVDDFELGNSDHNINLGLKLTLDANLHIEYLLDSFDCEYTWDYNIDLKTQYIELRYEPKISFELVARKLIPNVNDLLSVNAKWDSGYDGLIQVIILLMLSEKIREHRI